MKDDFLRENLFYSELDSTLSTTLYPFADCGPDRRFKAWYQVAFHTCAGNPAQCLTSHRLNAYQQLIAEGYLDGMVGHGTFVSQIVPEHLMTSPPRKDLVETSLAEPNKPRFSEQAALHSWTVIL